VTEKPKKWPITLCKPAFHQPPASLGEPLFKERKPGLALFAQIVELAFV
jgi:hypothetical protein